MSIEYCIKKYTEIKEYKKQNRELPIELQGSNKDKINERNKK